MIKDYTEKYTKILGFLLRDSTPSKILTDLVILAIFILSSFFLNYDIKSIILILFVVIQILNPIKERFLSSGAIFFFSITAIVYLLGNTKRAEQFAVIAFLLFVSFLYSSLTNKVTDQQ